MELEVARLQAGAAQHGKAWLQQEVAAKALTLCIRLTAGCAPMGRRQQRDQGRPSCRCRGAAVPTGQDRNLESFAGVCFAVLIVASSSAASLTPSFFASGLKLTTSKFYAGHFVDLSERAAAGDVAPRSPNFQWLGLTSQSWKTSAWAGSASTSSG